MAVAIGWLLVLPFMGRPSPQGVAFYQFVRDRPGVKLLLVPVVSEDAGGRLVERWMVRIVNHRKRPISIDGAGVLVGDREQLQSPYVDYEGNAVAFPFPTTLTDGQDVRVFKKVIAGRGTEVTGAWATDALGRMHTARYPRRNPKAMWRNWRLNRKIKRWRRARRKQKR